MKSNKLFQVALNLANGQILTYMVNVPESLQEVTDPAEMLQLCGSMNLPPVPESFRISQPSEVDIKSRFVNPATYVWYESPNSQIITIHKLENQKAENYTYNDILDKSVADMLSPNIPTTVYTIKTNIIWMGTYVGKIAKVIDKMGDHTTSKMHVFDGITETVQRFHGCVRMGLLTNLIGNDTATKNSLKSRAKMIWETDPINQELTNGVVIDQCGICQPMKDTEKVLTICKDIVSLFKCEKILYTEE